MGPTSAKSYPGVKLGPTRQQGSRGPDEGRAKPEIAYGRRGQGDSFGARQATTGAVLTAPDPSRSAANFAALREQVAAWRPPEAERGSAILDNLEAQRATDVLLFALAPPAGSSCSRPRTPRT